MKYTTSFSSITFECIELYTAIIQMILVTLFPQQINFLE